MKTSLIKVTPEILYSISKKGSLEKIQHLEQLMNSRPMAYEIPKDYYRKLRDAVCRCLKNDSIERLPQEVGMMKLKDKTQYSSFIALSHSVIELFAEDQFVRSSRVICKKVLNEEVVVSAPNHLSLKKGNEEWIVWFYFCLPELSQERIQFQLQLMRHLSEGQGVPTIVDVHRERIFQAEENNLLSFVVQQEIDFIDSYIKRRTSDQSFAA